MDPSIAKCDSESAAGERKTNKEIGDGVTDQRLVIAQLNIQHFRKKLMAEQDAEKRATLQRLLLEEEVKLAALKKESGERNTNHND
jgi:hypothetical protein